MRNIGSRLLLPLKHALQLFQRMREPSGDWLQFSRQSTLIDGQPKIPFRDLAHGLRQSVERLEAKPHQPEPPCNKGDKRPQAGPQQLFSQ